MREPERVEIGQKGEKAVASAFMQLGWPSADAPGSDLGTDLFLLVRNRRFDLGLIVGAQVKTGRSFFEEPETGGDGEPVGWWFRERDREHVDYWLGHIAPHLLVLHDLDTGLSHWQHVSQDTVVPTGKGVKILIPRAHTVDQSNLDALLAVAGTTRPPVTWEGSAWADITKIAPAQILRHALLVPRLVAPHRNAGHKDTISAEQAVALLIEGRLRDLDSFGKRDPSIPTFEGAEDSPDWMWRFVHAMYVRVTTDDPSRLVKSIDDAPSPEARAAATVAAAASLSEQARPEDALRLVQQELERDESSPVDHAWLLAQRARTCRELGHIEQAREDATAALLAKVSYSNDVTATAIGGAATGILWLTSDFTSFDLENTIASYDTSATWWRTQRAATGTTAVVEREFRNWAGSQPIVFGDGDVANNRLYTAALLASHVGDHGAWSSYSSLNVQQHLLSVTRTSDIDAVRRLLTELRLTGDHKALGRAVPRLMLDGPAAAVAAAATDIDLDRWSHTPAHATLTLLRQSGDVLDGDDAAKAVDWILATLDDPAQFEATTTPEYSTEHELIMTLSGIVAAAPLDRQQAIAHRVANLPPVQHASPSMAWTAVVNALPVDCWPTDLLSRAARYSDRHDARLRMALLQTAAPVDEQVRQRLLDEVAAGSADALASLRDVQGLDHGTAKSLIVQFEAQTVKEITNARRGKHHTYSDNAVDPARTLALLNLTYPDLARWPGLYEFLAEPLVAGRRKQSTCDLLSSNVAELSEGVRLRLAHVAKTMLTHPPTAVERIAATPNARDAAATLIARLGDTPEAIANHVLELMSGGVRGRSRAAHHAILLPDAEAAGMLSALSHDEDHRVRAEAAATVMMLVARGRGGLLATRLLGRSLDDPGILVAQAVADRLVRIEYPNAACIDIARRLLSHHSARVRARCTAFLRRHHPHALDTRT
ncbi:DUF4365 domain-containing protein [Saccharothrix sp. NPDC042600]|uniref:DUF4365 domain-containing protein n=1 Tax=Saccharothrix TaxID=2071 RepID=UPI00340FB436|nr:hypothetical protein GCM10017745_67920 [Saccharothrix mutabilis subsp. capreolus]